MTRTRYAAAAAAVLALTATGLTPSADAGPPRAHHRVGWVNGWQGSPTAANTVSQPSCPSDLGLRDQTVRNIVVSSVSGDRARVRLSNLFGTRPLRVDSASLAVAVGNGPGVVASSRRALRFDGHRSVVVPKGHGVLSDPVRLGVPAGRKLAITVHPRGVTGLATQHNDANQTSYLASGRATGSVGGERYGQKISCWLFARALDVHPARRVVGTVVTFGDSLTDGFASTTDRDRRYPDVLAERLRAKPGRTLSVSNAGISGNALLMPIEGVPAFGDAGLQRLRRDVLARPHVTDVVVLIGVNDIGLNGATADELVSGHRRLVSRLHRAGISVVGVTLPPFGGSNATLGSNYGTPAGEAARQGLNDWIRTSGRYDAVVDADHLLQDPADPSRLRAAYDSGDHLHPNDAGYAVIANAVDVRRLVRR